MSSFELDTEHVRENRTDMFCLMELALDEGLEVEIYNKQIYDHISATPPTTKRPR